MLRKVTGPLSSFVWLSPFLVFASTYFILFLIFRPATVATPSCVGLHLTQAVKQLSKLHMHVQIAATVPDAQLPDGIVTQQMPAPGMNIKEQQAIYIVISEQPSTERAPELRHKTEHEIINCLQTLSCRPTFCYLPYPVPTGTCFAQWPAAHEPLDSKHIICYVAQPAPHLVIWPDLSDLSLDKAQEFLKAYEVQVIVETNKRTSTAHVASQQPRAGSIINLSSPHVMTAYLT